MLVQLLEKLISKKYYETKEEIESKLNVFYAMSKISDEEYSNLILKAEEVYVVEETSNENMEEVVEETPVEEIETPVVEETEETTESEEV